MNTIDLAIGDTTLSARALAYEHWRQINAPVPVIMLDVLESLYEVIADLKATHAAELAAEVADHEYDERRNAEEVAELQDKLTALQDKYDALMRDFLDVARGSLEASAAKVQRSH